MANQSFQENTKWYNSIHNSDVALVGGKNASLGEMYNTLSSKGINIPNGFCITANAYWDFIHTNNLFDALSDLMVKLDRVNYANLEETGKKARNLMLGGKFTKELSNEIVTAYHQLCKEYGANTDVAVRSSATAEDLPNASFAGQHDSYLNISGDYMVLDAIRNCFASLFTDRAIKYREDNGFKHMQIALSVGIQKMVRSDRACSGVAFTLEPESGFKDIVLITGSWGLGENVVQGTVNPDEFYVFKPTFLTREKWHYF